jgi:hypothetical protein
VVAESGTNAQNLPLPTTLADAKEFIAKIESRSADVLARLFSGQPYADAASGSLPEWIITPSNLPSDLNGGYPATVADYQAQYNKLWGIG